MRSAVFTLVVALSAASAQAQPSDMPRVTFEEAIRTALEKNPGVAEAAQSILRAEALLQQTRTVFRPSVSASAVTNVLDAERGFDEFVVQPQVQSVFGASVSYPVLAASRWAATAQAEDQVRLARRTVEETRRQIAVATAQAYLAINAAERQVEVNLRALENAQAHLDYARALLQGGAGSKLNELRAAQEFATDEVLLEATRLILRRAQEALGVLMGVNGPVDAAGEPAFAVPAETPADPETFLSLRADVRLFTQQVQAAERVYNDSWRDWVPSATAGFQPQLLAPAGLFQPARTWVGFVAFDVPVFDAGSRRAVKRERQVARDTARIQLTDVELRAKSEVRTARASLQSAERALEKSRLAAQHAADVLRITDLAFRAGATTNLELVDAQRGARDADTAVTIAEDRVRQYGLDLLVALGRFPQ
jgi:outer membrane protein TolC